ncbi:MAG: hypothetical protein NTU98_08975 [Bacteroidetes bacterium]|nr:hypothetical protein [Bacteroidota bacterium]
MKNNIHKSFRLLFISALLGVFIVSISGCKKKSETSSSSGHQIQQLVTNGTIIPLTSNSIKGTLFVVDEKGQAITSITSTNVTATLSWLPPKSVLVDSSRISALVHVTGNSQSGLKVAAAITMDYSGSMTTYTTTIPSMERGVKTFIHSMAPLDMGEIIKFSTEVFVPQPFTNDTSLLVAGVNNEAFNLYNNTALYQSIYQGLTDASQLDTSLYIPSVIGFTDGGENVSTITESEMLDFAILHGIPINTIGFLTDQTDTTDLKYIAASTGGFFFLADNDSTFSKIYSTISGQLKNSYSYTAQWQGTLPPSGTIVTATVTTTYQGKRSSFSRTYYQP